MKVAPGGGGSVCVSGKPPRAFSGAWNSLPRLVPCCILREATQNSDWHDEHLKILAAFVVILGEDVSSSFVMFPFMWRKPHKGSDPAFSSSLHSQRAECRRRNRVY